MNLSEEDYMIEKLKGELLSGNADRSFFLPSDSPFVPYDWTFETYDEWVERKLNEKGPMQKLPVTQELTSFMDTVMWFGMHEGKLIKDIPLGYILWLTKNLDNGFERNQFLRELKRRYQDMENS
jgi:uncharacterized protein (DUF3820 family)